MTKLKTGDTMPDFTYCTPFEAGQSLAAAVQRAPRTLLLFLRYYGCTLCQFDIHQLKEHYAELAAGGGQVLVVLQSDPAALARQLGAPDALPFPLVCDPEQTLYRRFGIEPAASKLGMADAGTIAKIAKAQAAGFRHGDYEGNELQLPAAFVLDAGRRVLYAHYGKSAGDLPSLREMIALLN